MLATTNPISRTCTYDKHVENYGLQLINLVSSLFSNSPMVALFTAHSGMYSMTLLLHTSYPRLLFHVQEPKCALVQEWEIPVCKSQVLCAQKDRIYSNPSGSLCKLRKQQWIQVLGPTVFPQKGSPVFNSRDFTYKDRIYKNPMCSCARINSSQCATVRLLFARIGFRRTPSTVVQG
jgi:hypothetical protein